jgi:hypothetical protein
LQNIEYVSPVCLPKLTDPYHVDGVVTLAGWGAAGYEGFKDSFLIFLFFYF